MNGKSATGSPGGAACIEGLPPLPKSLSGLLNSSGGSWRDMERMYVKKTMIQDDLSRGRNTTDGLLAHKPASLDAALALLRKEMVRILKLFTLVGHKGGGGGGGGGGVFILHQGSLIPEPGSKAPSLWCTNIRSKVF